MGKTKTPPEPPPVVWESVTRQAETESAAEDQPQPEPATAR